MGKAEWQRQVKETESIHNQIEASHETKKLK
jgi:hypothetical protein